MDANKAKSIYRTKMEANIKEYEDAQKAALRVFQQKRLEIREEYSNNTGGLEPNE